MDIEELTSSELASERYLDLVAQLREEDGASGGWQSRIANRLGVSQAYISLLSSGRRAKIGTRALRGACRTMQLKPEFFTIPMEFDEEYEQPIRLLYEDYLIEGASAPERPDPTAVAKSHMDLVASAIVEADRNGALATTQPLIAVLAQMVAKEPLIEALREVEGEIDMNVSAIENGLKLAKLVLGRYDDLPEEVLDRIYADLPDHVKADVVDDYLGALDDR